KRRRFVNKRLWLVLVALIAYIGWALFRPLPLIKPQKDSTILQFDTGSPALAWPNVQAAVGIVGSNVLETHGVPKPLPTASTAKLITALMVLKQKPLAAGQPGPAITLSAADQAIYNAYVAQGGSTVPVQA